MNSTREFIELIGRSFSVIAQVSMAFMALLITGNVLLRLTPVGPIEGTFELTGYLGAFLIALALANTQINGRNIAVDFLVSRLSSRTQAAIDSVTHLASTFLCWVIGWCSFEEGMNLMKTGEVTPTLSLPFLPIYAVIALGCVFLGFVLLTDSLNSMRKVLGK